MNKFTPHPRQTASRLHNPRSGFTLLEMALVIGVVGLLVGGVIGGRYMVQQAEMQSTLSDFMKYKAAYFQFQDKFGGSVPGDMINAVEYWGQEGGGAGDNYSASCNATAKRVPQKLTCNSYTYGVAASIALYGTGDNKRIDKGTWEMARAWQHLANAGLIAGLYTGDAGTGGPAHMVPTAANAGGAAISPNAPSGKRAGTGYTMYWLGLVYTDGNVHEYDDDYKTVILYGASTATDITSGPALSPRTAQAMDLKADDGKPGTGTVYSWSSPGCVNDTVTTNGATATYLGTTDIQCNLGYRVE